METIARNVLLWTYWTVLLALMVLCLPLVAVVGLVFDED